MTDASELLSDEEWEAAIGFIGPNGSGYADALSAERAARKAAEKERDEARRQIEASGRVYGMVQQASSQVAAANVKLREVLIEAKAAVNLLENLCACGADDDYVWDLQDKIDAALSPTTDPTI
ncbi:hypothetical protein LB518_22630 [Mesorhizobium sp. BR1-1-16]|uniref:hypothetical protein n=1 Tax=Mesorhizobium sp. BR1-1-16 TaxID=2876653 RepID=UPI001CCB37DA|nr:hypothetical protein [Mesorhizobium sp. BR1-1-16]MBZ9939110.1 hypothetical protein [Mesorhizobium sp. BR1-1-16]